MRLKFNFDFYDLHSLSGLSRLDKSFLNYLSDGNKDLYRKIILYRQKAPTGLEYSEFLLQLAPILDDFISYLFSIEDENLALKKQHEKFDIIYEARRKFVQRYVLKKYSKEDIKSFDFVHIESELKKLIGSTEENVVAANIIKWQSYSDNCQEELSLIAKYCAYKFYNNSDLMLFDIPLPVEENHLRDRKIEIIKKNICLGFDYRDTEQSVDKAFAHSKYCIYCHKQDKDSCSKGIKESNKNGCPLEQKISEMHNLKSEGLNIAALAVTMVDNPMVAATGHRICNDCMKSCIYQKQDPVNTPLVESNILQQVLSLPWGVEIYYLLSRWNPLILDSYLPKEKTNKNILVVGLGPAGFALSYYLLKDGHNIFAIDGLKISPLKFDIKKPIKFWKDVIEPLSARDPQGFGGVAEYGITNRWDKNNLTLLRIILERFSSFEIQGGVRLGSNITIKQAFELGYHHIALCLGAGKPHFVGDDGYFAKGVRTASDFLMNLQQAVPYLPGSNGNLQIRLPAIVIGCGLTAIDSAVEILHYYPLQVEKFYINWKKKDNPEFGLSDEDLEIAREFIAHAKLFEIAKTNEEKLAIMQNIGGVTICYRKSLQESPAYRLNPEEIEHALAIGVRFEEFMSPNSIKQDKHGSVESIIFSGGKSIKARSVLVAIGTKANEFDDIEMLNQCVSDIFKTENRKISYFGDCNPKYAGNVVKAIASAKNGYKSISEELEKLPESKAKIENRFKSYIHAVNKLSDDILELVVRSPIATENFKPGQFFKLQNYSSKISDAIEPIALTGSYVDKKAGLISLIILQIGKSTNLCKNFKKGEEILLMGPNGTPTEIPKNQNIVLVGGGLGNAALVPIAKAMKENNNHVTYFAGYKKTENRFYPERIEQNTDIVVWACEDGSMTKSRATDFFIKGNVIDGLRYAKRIGLIDSVDLVMSVGSDKMMQAVWLHKKEFFEAAKIISSLNSPMQCMMKGICGQCVQKVNDGRGYIFSCICQDQDSDNIDFSVLSKRLGQNSLLERM